MSLLLIYSNNFFFRNIHEERSENERVFELSSKDILRYIRESSNSGKMKTVYSYFEIFNYKMFYTGGKDIYIQEIHCTK